MFFQSVLDLFPPNDTHLVQFRWKTDEEEAKLFKTNGKTVWFHTHTCKTNTWLKLLLICFDRSLFSRSYLASFTVNLLLFYLFIYLLFHICVFDIKSYFAERLQMIKIISMHKGIRKENGNKKKTIKLHMHKAIINNRRTNGTTGFYKNRFQSGWKQIETSQRGS